MRCGGLSIHYIANIRGQGKSDPGAPHFDVIVNHDFLLTATKTNFDKLIMLWKGNYSIHKVTALHPYCTLERQSLITRKVIGTRFQLSNKPKYLDAETRIEREVSLPKGDGWVSWAWGIVTEEDRYSRSSLTL